jgi:hypothetical protein
MTRNGIPESPLRKEVRLFSEGFSRVLSALMNKLFDLSPRAASIRLVWLVILFFLTGFLISLNNYPLVLWLQRLQDIFLYIFNRSYRETYVGDPLLSMALFVWQVFIDPRNLHLIPLMLAPFFISLQSAAMYLADIFELEDVSVARKHVLEVALTGSDETIRISKGAVIEEDQQSPNFLIGGPGKVIVDLDSAALFEKPDGTPHVIGPTAGQPGGKAVIEGFERFREAIDLRDQYIYLRDQDDRSPSVKGRSRDGIPVTATDVRMIFSVHRKVDDTPEDVPTNKMRDSKRSRTKGKEPDPYPFSRKAIENIVYKAASQVTPEQENPSTYKFSWINNMIGLVRGELGGFMSQRDLTAYLANTSHPEREKALLREDAYVEQARKLFPPHEDPPEPQEVPPVPEFTPRHKITNLFSEFTEKFTNNARDRGVELRWIGVGTWKTPIPNVVENHLEAWKLSRENQANGSEDAMKEFEDEISLNKLIEFIREVPILTYRKLIGSTQPIVEPETNGVENEGEVSEDEDTGPSGNARPIILSLFGGERQKTISHSDAMKQLLIEYRKLLIEAAEFIQAKNELVPFRVTRGIRYIEDVLAWPTWHWLGRNTSIRDDTEVESGPSEAAYQQLIQLVGGDKESADRLIEEERTRFPAENREELAERAIERLIRDRQ